MMSASKIFIGLLPSLWNRTKTNNTSTDVMMTPAHSGKLGNKRHKPMADPSNSARSVAIIAISQTT